MGTGGLAQVLGQRGEGREGRRRGGPAPDSRAVNRQTAGSGTDFGFQVATGRADLTRGGLNRQSAGSGTDFGFQAATGRAT